jgi:hypothetical protein
MGHSVGRSVFCGVSIGFLIFIFIAARSAMKKKIYFLVDQFRLGKLAIAKYFAVELCVEAGANRRFCCC